MAEQMKPSGIEWIGDIPNEWGITKVRFVTKLRSEQGFYSSDDKYIGLENISSYTGEYISTESEYDADTYDLYKAGDLLFSKLRPYLAKALIADDYGFCTGELAVIKEYNGDIRYLFYYMLSDGFLKMVDTSTYGAKMPRASWDYIKNLQIPVMRKSEQQTLADFLDKECAQIDSIVVDLEKQIALLQQYKKSLITETVTKGLDKSVPMKDSGIEWIGKIPEHWNVTKIKYFCRMYSGENLTSADIEPDGDYPVYGGNGKRGFYSNFTNDGEHVLIGRQGALCGNVHLVSGKFWATDHAVVTYPTKEIINKYLYYLLQSMNLNQYSQSAAQPGLAVNVILALKACLPSTLKEQKTIVDFLDDKCLQVDQIILQKENQFNILQQHKKSLIYEYVTGKKRVKEVR